MNLGVQYYRAPFPNSRYWDDDFSRIRDAGFNCVQLREMRGLDTLSQYPIMVAK